MSQALYDRIGIGYSEYRPDERIARRIDAALGRSRSVLNTGAGAGSYEPRSRLVLVQDYLPEILAIDRPNFPSLREIEKAIGPTEVVALPIAAGRSRNWTSAIVWSSGDAYLPELSDASREP